MSNADRSAMNLQAAERCDSVLQQQALPRGALHELDSGEYSAEMDAGRVTSRHGAR